MNSKTIAVVIVYAFLFFQGCSASSQYKKEAVPSYSLDIPDTGWKRPRGGDWYLRNIKVCIRYSNGKKLLGTIGLIEKQGNRWIALSTSHLFYDQSDYLTAFCIINEKNYGVSKIISNKGGTCIVILELGLFSIQGVPVPKGKIIGEKRIITLGETVEEGIVGVYKTRDSNKIIILNNMKEYNVQKPLIPGLKTIINTKTLFLEFNHGDSGTVIWLKGGRLCVAEGIGKSLWIFGNNFLFPYIKNK